MPPKFIYFDLGNVLLNFDHKRACRQMAEVAGTTAESVWTAVFAGDLEARYESGQLDDRAFYDAFCQATGTCGDFDKLLLAGSEIFDLNLSILPVVAQLDAAGHRLGILSNTCPAHWAYCTAGRFGILTQAFDVVALSYQIGACKPDAKIFAAAAELAGVRPQEVFYVDDIAGHVAGARAAGFDAVQYTTTPALVDELLKRGVEFNY
jgi:putative hydrolase of the HAD superfamily